MTITAVGPDGTSFNFPDETSSDVVSSTIRKHYGTEPAPQKAAPPTTAGMVATELGRGVPVLGPAITNRIGSAGREEWEQAHPWLSTGLQLAGGTTALGLAPEAEAAAFGTSMIPKALGMTGRLLPAAVRGAASGAVINAADAAARGEDPGTGAGVGALTGAGGVLGGKLAGMAYDAALRRFRPLAPVQRLMPGGPVAGVDVPVSAAQEATALGRPDITGSRTEERMRKTGVQTAVDATQATNDAMAQAHDNFSNMINPNTQPGVSQHPLDAGEAATGDLVAQEQARAQAEVARMAGAQAQTQTLRQGYTPGAAAPPASALDVGQTFGQRIRDLFTGARARTTAAYGRAAQVDAAYNPLYMRNVGDTLLDAVNARPDVVRVDPDNTPAAFRAVQSIDRQIQAQLLNAARRGEQLGPMEMEQVRKSLNIQQQNAVAAARASNNYEDVRAIGRVKDAFDDWEQQLAATPGTVAANGTPIAGGLLRGDPNEIFATRQAARAAHAQERATFGRRGPGDPVGTFMGNVLGRYPGQELSPEGIVQKLMGSPDRTFSENAGPILTHLRDNVFGANSPEWAQLKQGVIDHLTGTPPGGEPVPLAKQVQRIERYLANDRTSGAIHTPRELADLASHANNLRAAYPDEIPASGTVERDIAQQAGRFGQRGSGQELLNRLNAADGDQYAARLRQLVSPDTWNQLRQAVWERISEQPRGMISWQDQRTGQNIAKFLNTPVAREMFDTNERAIMSSIAQAHIHLIPTPGSVNTSGTAYMNQEIGGHVIKGLKAQLMKLIFAHFGHIPGYMLGEAIERGSAKAAERRAAEDAIHRFIGERPLRAPVTAPQRFGATAGRLIRPPTGGEQAQQSGG